MSVNEVFCVHRFHYLKHLKVMISLIVRKVQVSFVYVRQQWLQHKNNWPPDIVPNPCQETLPEAKATQDVFAMAVAETDELDMLLEKFSYWKVMRMCA